MFGRQDTEGNVLLRAMEAAEKLIKVSSCPLGFTVRLVKPRQKDFKGVSW